MQRERLFSGENDSDHDWRALARQVGVPEWEAFELYRQASELTAEEPWEVRAAYLELLAQARSPGSAATSGVSPGKLTLTAGISQPNRRRGSASPGKVTPCTMKLAMYVADGTAVPAAAAAPGIPVLRRARSTPADPGGAALEQALACEGGEPLPEPLRRMLEARFGVDLGGVRIHTDDEAAAAAMAASARAFTVGEHVFFGSGEFAPRQDSGLELVAHEIAHVVQFYQGRVQRDGTPGLSRPDDPLEREAEQVGRAVAAVEHLSIRSELPAVTAMADAGATGMGSDRADAVAERVVRGESAEASLDTVAHQGPRAGLVVQRRAAGDVEGNVTGLTGDRRTGRLDGRSLRRVWERLAQLDPEVDAAAWDTMSEPERREALASAIERFQAREHDRIAEIRTDQDVRESSRRGAGRQYDRPATGAMSEFTAPRADYHAREIRPNDVTAQALANAWPQMFFGQMLEEAQAYELLRRMVLARGLEFDADGINVIGMRAFQGGDVHDNAEDDIYTQGNHYNDTVFLLSRREGAPRVEQARGTVDPGGRSGHERTVDPRAFQVGADQQWDYAGRPRSRSEKFDRAIYTLPDPADVRRGRYWEEHPDQVPDASTGAGRITTRGAGRTEFDRSADGDIRSVSALHSGGRGGGDRDTVMGDSTGCTVVSGAWFPHFNESLRRAGGEADSVRFTYSLIDPRMFSRQELAALLAAAGRPNNASRTARSAAEGETAAGAGVGGDAAARDGAAGTAEPPVQPDGGRLEADGGDVHREAAAGVAGSGTQLPHLTAIQDSFGHHDVSGVRAHVGGPAAVAADAIGARAYATGDDVAFAAAPDVRQAAHEAAHVVQQRGGVRLDGGVGRAGDQYEQHADTVAERVVRGESAEVLLDTMAHRGAAGGPAVQRDAETHEQLQAALDAVDAIADLGPTEAALAGLHPRLPADRNTEYTVPIGGADHTVRGRDVRWLRNHVRTRRQRLDQMGPRGSGAWDGTSAPLRGQSLGGHTIEVDGRHKVVRVSGVRLQITHKAVWGIVFYDSDSLERLHAAAERVAVRETNNGHPYRAAAARGMQVTGEGGIAAINTYDGMTFTLGPGYAGGRLNRMLGHLAGTPAGAALAGVSYLAGGRFNGSADIIRDVDALARIVTIIRAHEAAVAEAQVLEWIDGSAMSDRRDAAGETEGDALAPRVMPELIGVAAYLRHGLPSYAPDPIGDATRAADEYPSSPSRQLAVVLKLYAQRVSASPPGQSLLATIIDERIPNKVSHFIRAATARDPSFQFNLAEAQAEIPCLQLLAPWPHVTPAPAGVSLHLTRDRGQWWNFGDPI